jgi:RNA polymerase sigma-70 factor (ECF subfamily)
MTTRRAEADAADIGELYRQHAETVARWVARLGGPLMDVDDAVHEVFMIAQRRRPRTHGPAQITTWLYRVTAKVVSHRRRKDRIRRWLCGSADDVAAGMMAVERSPAEALEAKERSLLVYRVLDRLTEKQRAVLILFEMEGLSGEEISTLYRVKVATVWVWFHRARASFLAQLERLEAKEAG